MKILLNIFLFLAVIILSGWIDEVLEISSPIPLVFMMVGAFSIFIGRFATHSGFYYQFRFVDTATPKSLWVILGIGLWIIAIAWGIYSVATDDRPNKALDTTMLAPFTFDNSHHARLSSARASL